MGDIEANEGAAVESSSLIDRGQPAVLKMRVLHGKTMKIAQISATLMRN
jgi:hypothetical protein